MLPAVAQSPDYFIPGQPKPAQGTSQPRPARSTPRAQPAPVLPPAAMQGEPGLPLGAGPGEADQSQQPIDVPLPPAPEVPPLPAGNPPPPAVIGVLGVPDVMHASSAAQQVDKIIGQRREKLNEDAQKEQTALRDLGQALANDRGKMTPEQIRNKERELQDRIADSRRKFGERNRIIQESGQYVMAQIDRTLEQVAQAVAASRGVNLVLNRAQILGTTADFDLTPQVAEVLNKVLPSVVVPPDGVAPVTMAATPQGGATPASAPASQPAPAAGDHKSASPKPAAPQKK
jgi:Skp family chaperone for outer membrane proteins